MLLFFDFDPTQKILEANLAASHDRSTELEKLRQLTGKRMTGSEWATPVRPWRQRERLTMHVQN